MAISVNQLLKGSGSIDFEVASIGPQESFQKKSGGSYMACECKLKTRSNGEIYTVRLFPDFLQRHHIETGSLLRGTHGEPYPQWAKVPIGEAALTHPSPSNYKQVQGETAMKGEKDDYEKQKRIHDFKLGLAGVVQSMIADGRTDDEITKGEPNKKSAVEWCQWIRTTSASLAND